MSLPVRLLEYRRSWNIGDEIQTLAVRQHLSSASGYVDRDELDLASGDPFAVVMQGWFAKRPETLLLADSVHPVWIGFHLSSHLADEVLRPEVRAKLAADGPIGCRDTYTASLLADQGIDAYVSGCLTTTFPKRQMNPEKGSIYLVDTTGIPLPEHIRHPSSVRVTHEGAPWWSQVAKRGLAGDVLREYRDYASMVVTTRLHCALPCVAMGIPVVFVGDPFDERLAPIRPLAEIIPFPAELRREAAVTRVRRRARWWREMRDLPWTGHAADIEREKSQLVSRLREGIARVGA